MHNIFVRKNNVNGCVEYLSQVPLFYKVPEDKFQISGYFLVMRVGCRNHMGISIDDFVTLIGREELIIVVIEANFFTGRLHGNSYYTRRLLSSARG